MDGIKATDDSAASQGRSNAGPLNPHGATPGPESHHFAHAQASGIVFSGGAIARNQETLARYRMPEGQPNGPAEASLRYFGEVSGDCRGLANPASPHSGGDLAPDPGVVSEEHSRLLESFLNHRGDDYMDMVNAETSVGGGFEGARSGAFVEPF
jgi:hypothetical protein